MKVVLLGGGYTSVWAYRALTRWLGRKVQITIISDIPHHVFHGFTGEVLAGDMQPHHVESPNLDWAPRAEHILGRATRVNTAAHTVSVAQADGTALEVPYDQLVVGTGARENTAAVPGLEEHGLKLRTHGVPERIVAAIEASPELEHGHEVVVVGAGFTGTESAVAIARRLGTRGKVTLVAGDGIVPVWSMRRLTLARVQRHLSKAAVEVRQGVRVTRVDEHSVNLNDGTVLPASLVVTALGYRPNVPAGLEAHTDEQSGYLVVDRNLQVADGIWAAGDVAAVQTPSGKLAHKDALWAIMAGTRVGRNIARVARGAKPKPLGFRGLGAAATFAPGQSVTVIFGITLPGALAYVIRQTLFLWFMPSRRAALRALRA